MTDTTKTPDDLGGAFWHTPHPFDGILPPLESSDLEQTQFALLADHIPTACWIARGDGYIVWYNQRWHQYCGTTPEAMEGWGWQDVHDPLTLPRVMERWVESINLGRPFDMVFPLRGADGVFRPFLTRVSPLRDATGQVVRWFGVNTEIGAQIRAEDALRASEARYTILTEAMPQMVWSTRPDGFHDYYNRRWYDLTGVAAGSTDGDGWSRLLHPDDRSRAQDSWQHSVATGLPYEVEYRLRHQDGHYRWTLGRAVPVRGERGEVTRWIGTGTDIHDAKLASEQTEILTRELSHRIKNIFAIIGSLIRISLRLNPSANGFARDLLDRIHALGRAHEFARPHSDESQPQISGSQLQGLLTGLFLPYQEADRERIRVTGSDTDIDDKGATPIALLFHELATNAVKYGALSGEDGSVHVDILMRGDELELTWRETGGPAITSKPVREGFGTKLASMSIDQQLGGRFEQHWLPTGLVAIVVVKRANLVRT